jgi:hypothetical protein
MKPSQHALLWGLVLLVLLGVFSLYLRPEFMRDLSDLVWACL